MSWYILPASDSDVMISWLVIVLLNELFMAHRQSKEVNANTSVKFIII